MKINHIALKVLDVESISKFYGEILGLPILRRNEDHKGLYSIWHDLDGAILMIERLSLGSSNSGNMGWHILALQIEQSSRDGWRKRLAEARVQIEEESDFTLYFKDPEGNRIALSHFSIKGQNEVTSPK